MGYPGWASLKWLREEKWCECGSAGWAQTLSGAEPGFWCPRCSCDLRRCSRAGTGTVIAMLQSPAWFAPAAMIRCPMERDLGRAGPGTASSAGDLCAGRSARRGAPRCVGKVLTPAGQMGSDVLCSTGSRCQTNIALVKPSPARAGMSHLLHEASRGSLPFESLYSQLSAPLPWAPSPFHRTPPEKDSSSLMAPSMSSQPAWSFPCPLQVSMCLFIAVDQTCVPRQPCHGAARGPLRGQNPLQHPNVPRQRGTYQGEPSLIPGSVC